MTKRHAKHKKIHTDSQEEARIEPLRNEARQAGFFSFDLKRFMSRKDKFIIIVIVLGVIALIVASTYLIVGVRQANNIIEEEEVLTDPDRVVTTPYPTIPKEITQTTIMINNRAILPLTVTVKKGAEIGFFNEDSTPITIQGYDGASEILNIGPVAPYDVPVVVLDKVGTYRYLNPQNPAEVAEIVVKE